MRLDQEEQSSNVEDRRGARFSPGLATGGIGTLAIVLIGLFFGIDPTVLLQGTSVDTNAPPASTERGADSNDPMKDFVARVLAAQSAPGAKYLRATVGHTNLLNWCFLAAGCNPRAASRKLPPGRSIVRKITRSISISIFIVSCATASRLPVILPRLT